METTINALEGCRREIEITVEKHELEPHFRKAYAEAQPEISVKGFRKGRVPLEVIRKRFGKKIEQNALDDIANEVFGTAIRDKDIKVIGRPMLRSKNLTPEGKLSVVVAYDELPEITLGEYRGLTVDKPVTEVNDDLVDREIDRICLEQGSMEEAEQVEDDNFVVKVAFQEIDKDTGVPLVGGPENDVQIFLADKALKANLKQLLLNTKVGDSFEYTVNEGEEGEAPLRRNVSVKDIRRVVPAEFSNDFVEQISGGKFISTEEFRSDVEMHLKDGYAKRSDEAVDVALVDKILEMHPFTAPESLVQEAILSMLNEQKERSAEKKLPPNFDMNAFFQAARPQAERSTRWFILRELIIEKEGLAVEDADLASYAQKVAENTQLPVEQILPYISENEQIKKQILSEKALELVRDYAIITDVDYQPED